MTFRKPSGATMILSESGFRGWNDPESILGRTDTPPGAAILSEADSIERRERLSDCWGSALNEIGTVSIIKSNFFPVIFCLQIWALVRLEKNPSFCTNLL